MGTTAKCSMHKYSLCQQQGKTLRADILCFTLIISSSNLRELLLMKSRHITFISEYKLHNRLLDTNKTKHFNCTHTHTHTHTLLNAHEHKTERNDTSFFFFLVPLFCDFEDGSRSPNQVKTYKIWHSLSCKVWKISHLNIIGQHSKFLSWSETLQLSSLSIKLLQICCTGSCP